MGTEYSEDLQKILREIDNPSLYNLIEENEEIVIEMDSKLIAVSRSDGKLRAKILDSITDSR